MPVTEQSFARVEVLSGPERRRRWSREEKAAIVAESLATGAVARRVALRHGLHPNQLYEWRRELAATGNSGCSIAVPFGAAAPGSITGLEIELCDAVVRVAPGVDMGFLAAVLGAVKQA